MNMDLNRFTGFVRRCADDYNMLAEGDRVAVGVSGGKDSMALLAALAHLRRYHPSRFELEAVTIDMGFPGMDFSPVAEWCAVREVPYTIIKTDIREIVFDARQEDNPCSLCSKMRRGALNDAIKARGCKDLIDEPALHRSDSLLQARDLYVPRGCMADTPDALSR